MADMQDSASESKRSNTKSITFSLARWRKPDHDKISRLEKKLDERDKEIKKLTKQQELRDLVKEVVDEAFNNNAQRTRLTCWWCDRAIDEGKGYTTWLGCRLHPACADSFQAKVKPVLQAHKDSHSNFLIEGLPVFVVEPKKEVSPNPTKAKAKKDVQEIAPQTATKERNEV